MFNLKKRGDILLIIFVVIVVICAAVFYLTNLSDRKSANIAIITYNGIIVKEINLTVDRIYSYPIHDSNDNEICCIEVDDSKVRFQHSTCPDQICVNSGWREHVNDFASCLPNGVVVTVK